MILILLNHPYTSHSLLTLFNHSFRSPILKKYTKSIPKSNSKTTTNTASLYTPTFSSHTNPPRFKVHSGRVAPRSVLILAPPLNAPYAEPVPQTANSIFKITY